MAKEKEKKKAGKSRSGKIRQIAQKGVMGLDNYVGKAEYLKYGDIMKVSDVDVRESVSAGRRTYNRDLFGADGWANRLYTTGGKPAGTKFRHGGKTYKIVAGSPSATAELVKT